MQGGVAVATSIDDNAADEKSDKSIWRLLNIQCTRQYYLPCLNFSQCLTIV